MSDETPPNSEPASETPQFGAIVVFVIFALGSAYVSMVLWALGAGVPRASHNAMGLLFALINIFCVSAGVQHLRNRKRSAAIQIALAPVPICILALMASVFLIKF